MIVQVSNLFDIFSTSKRDNSLFVLISLSLQQIQILT